MFVERRTADVGDWAKKFSRAATAKNEKGRGKFRGGVNLRASEQHINQEQVNRG